MGVLTQHLPPPRFPPTHPGHPHQPNPQFFVAKMLQLTLSQFVYAFKIIGCVFQPASACFAFHLLVGQINFFGVITSFSFFSVTKGKKKGKRNQQTSKRHSEHPLASQNTHQLFHNIFGTQYLTDQTPRWLILR